MKKYWNEEILESYLLITKYLRIINEKEIPKDVLNEAYQLCRDIDEDDTLFIACFMFLNAKLWTDDKELMNGLIKKGYNHFITTSELIG